ALDHLPRVMRPMRILHFVNAYFPTTGGTVTRIHNLFHDDGNCHTFVVPLPADRADTEGLPDEARFDNIQVHRVRIPAAAGLARFHPGYYRRQAEALVGRVAGEPFDLLYGHNPLTCAMAAAIFRASHPGVPFIYEAHGIMRDYSNVGPRRPFSALRDGLT